MGPEASGGKRKRNASNLRNLLKYSLSVLEKGRRFSSVIWINLEPKLIITYNTVYLREMY